VHVFLQSGAESGLINSDNADFVLTRPVETIGGAV